MTVEPVTSESIGAQIAEAITTSGIKFTRVAADLDVSEATLRRFIQGTNDPSFLQILRLSQILGCDIEWFVNGQKAAA